jgi:hypothetical protein
MDVVGEADAVAGGKVGVGVGGGVGDGAEGGGDTVVDDDVVGVGVAAGPWVATAIA